MIVANALAESQSMLLHLSTLPECRLVVRQIVGLRCPELRQLHPRVLRRLTGMPMIQFLGTRPWSRFGRLLCFLGTLPDLCTWQGWDLPSVFRSIVGTRVRSELQYRCSKLHFVQCRTHLLSPPATFGVSSTYPTRHSLLFEHWDS